MSIFPFVYEPDAITHIINYSFDNFYHNNIKYDGYKIYTRNMITTTANPTPHPKITMDFDMSATFPDGSVYSRVGSRNREIIVGYATEAWSDNIYKITGSWVTTDPSGGTKTSTITGALAVKMSCANQNKPLIVSGTISFVKNGNVAILDYGNGICDNLAVLTVNGTTYPIVIGN